MTDIATFRGLDDLIELSFEDQEKELDNRVNQDFGPIKTRIEGFGDIDSHVENRDPENQNIYDRYFQKMIQKLVDAKNQRK